MEKQQVVDFITAELAQGSITRNDLMVLAGGGSPAPLVETPSAPENSKHIIHVLYGIGATIAIVGIGTLIAQNWEELGFGGRMLVTLGIALVSYSAGLLFRNPEDRVLSQVMFTIAAVLAPGGIAVLLDEAQVMFTWSVHIWTSLMLSLVFGFALYVSRRSILVLILTAYGTWLYYAILFKLLEGAYHGGNLLEWATMFGGLAYIALAHGYTTSSPVTEKEVEREHRAVAGLLYGVGTLGILGTAITIGGVFDLIMIALIFAAFYGSVYLKSRAMLLLGALFLIAHIVKLTVEYFADSVGWPVALILVGFMVIGVGYFTYFLNRRYLKTR